jgi:3'-phosphoadenosine 5'-phosphosulfate sulfotransferase (PAPS reductase)/FAD synthetase
MVTSVLYLLFVDDMQGLCEHLEKHSVDQRPMAFVLGTRKGDPNANGQAHFCPSSSWMSGPAFMRVNPILDWDYGHVWHFLRCFRLDYCSLYDLVSVTPLCQS